MKRIAVIILILVSLTSCNGKTTNEAVVLSTNCDISFIIADCTYCVCVVSNDNYTLKLQIVEPKELGSLQICVKNDYISFSENDIVFSYDSSLRNSLHLLYYLYNGININSPSRTYKNFLYYDDKYKTNISIDESKRIVSATVDGVLFKVKGDEVNEWDTA